MKRSVVVVGVGLALAPVLCWAQDSKHQQAARAFEAARAYAHANDCRDALQKLEESVAFEPSVGAHLLMADCYEQIDLLAAWRHLKEATSLAMEKQDARASFARQRATQLEPKLATFGLVLDTPVDEPGLEVRLDGSLLPRFIYRDGIVATTLGAHDVDVVLPHKAPWHRRVTAVRGDVPGALPETVKVSLLDEAPPTPPPEVPPPLPPPAKPPTTTLPPPPSAQEERGSGRRPLVLIAGTVGVIGLGVGTVAGIVAISAKSAIGNDCTLISGVCTPKPSKENAASSDRTTLHTAETVSNIGFVAGAIGVVGAAVLYFTGPSPHAENRVAIVPVVGQGGGGISVAGGW